jgi:hypothetical protein
MQVQHCCPSLFFSRRLEWPIKSSGLMSVVGNCLASYPVLGCSDFCLSHHCDKISGLVQLHPPTDQCCMQILVSMVSKTTQRTVDDVLHTCINKSEAIDPSLTPGLTSLTMSQSSDSWRCVTLSAGLLWYFGKPYENVMCHTMVECKLGPVFDAITLIQA